MRMRRPIAAGGVAMVLLAGVGTPARAGCTGLEPPGSCEPMMPPPSTSSVVIEEARATGGGVRVVGRVSAADHLGGTARGVIVKISRPGRLGVEVKATESRDGGWGFKAYLPTSGGTASVVCAMIEQDRGRSTCALVKPAR